jgi:acetoin:2,6-dichlorophenolindophenol oxidoreductase subunit alpha
VTAEKKMPTDVEADCEPEPRILIEIYRRAALIQSNDLRIRSVLKSGKIAASYYSPRGQEIVPAAVSVSLTDDDYIVTTYRGIHDQVAKGIPLKPLWAEYAGRVTGTCKGKGGPMHITHPDTGVMVTTGIVGSGLPIAAGLALGSQILRDGRVTVCYFGDGASNIGAFHEALNLASLWKLPVVFVCQNNLYAEHSAFALGTSAARISDRAIGYQMPGVTVNGNDPIAMWSAAKAAIERARAGHGPTLIEAMTFRFLGHSMGDDSHYIPKQQMEAAIAADPVPALRAYLLCAGYLDEVGLAAIEAAIAQSIDEAVEFALASAYPAEIELSRDVFAEESIA